MRIAHLSDPHLARGPLAAQPAANLADAIGRVLAVEPRPDCIVITGDLADTGHPEEYAALHAILRRCPVPVHLMPGNHDDPDALIARFGDTPFLGDGLSTKYAVEYPEATIIVADSWMPDPAGELGPDQLSWIDRTLAAHRVEDYIDAAAVAGRAYLTPPVRVRVVDADICPEFGR